MGISAFNLKKKKKEVSFCFCKEKLENTTLVYHKGL